MCPDSFSKPSIEFFYEQKWICQKDMIKLLEEQRNISDIAYTHRNQVIDKLINAITSDSRSSNEDSLNKGYEVNQK